MNDNYDITIVIPSIIVSIHLKKCIESINNISSSISIIVVLDLYSEEVPILKNKYNSLIFCIPKNILNISQKRNIAVKKSNTKYIAFIDSDAYPDNDWLKNSINILEQYKDILIVGGPNISPPDQNIENMIIGEVQKSFLISGKWNFQKRLSKSRYTENLYSCNMVMLRSTFIDNGGMNEMLNAGEDYDFCCKINDNTKRIYFNNNSVVYHYDRNIHNFIIQKIVRGSTVIDQIRNNSSVLKK